MNLKRFRLTFVVALGVLLVFVALVRPLVFPHPGPWTGRLMLNLVILSTAIFVLGNGFDLVASDRVR